ncbi:MAG: hypothetical protein COB30_004505 [Ectothiorhodospiraceae bacterium]|nr:hypothetical protein [Ectothiorhodospiraceae bacterium]
MIRIRGPEKLFDLDVVGYEFPNAIDHDDANWLAVKISASDDDFTWEAEDSCLLTSELNEFKYWLQAISNRQPVNKIISFLEGELSFRYGFEDDVLEVGLDFIFHPKGERYIYGENGDKKYLMSFPLNRNIRGVIKSIDAILDKYPERIN